MSANLKVKIAGIEFENPLWLASGPWGGTGHKLKKVALDGKPGALVTKSIPWEPKIQVSPRAARNIYDKMFYGVDKTEPFTAHQWFSTQFPIAMEGGVPLIANINAGMEPIEKWRQACIMAEDAGAMAIELGFAAPSHGINFFIKPKCYGFQILEKIKGILSIPVFVKIPYLYPVSHIEEYVGALIDLGADAIVTCGNVSVTQVDIEAGRHTVGSATRSGTSYGAFAKPVSLAMVQIIVSKFSIPVIGTGGIRCGRDVIEYIMMGATATELVMQAMLLGPWVFKTINSQVQKWMADHEVEKLDTIRGKALGSVWKNRSSPILINDNPCDHLPD